MILLRKRKRGRRRKREKEGGKRERWVREVEGKIVREGGKLRGRVRIT